jgi:hypothetical protein
LGRITRPVFGRTVFGGEVVGELALSLFTLASAAASGNPFPAVSDDPERPESFGSLEIEAWSFGVSKHFPLISSIARNVVKSFPAILSIRSLPRAPSFRKPLAVIPPPGKAISAAAARRNGALWSISGGISAPCDVEF